MFDSPDGDNLTIIGLDTALLNADHSSGRRGSVMEDVASGRHRIHASGKLKYTILLQYLPYPLVTVADSAPNDG